MFEKFDDIVENMDVIACSGLLTTTISGMKIMIDILLIAADKRDKV